MDLKARRRVKVYQLNADGQWDDKGTGHVVLLYNARFGGIAMVVKSEESGGQVLLESKLYLEDIYQLQQDTLIVWNDPTTSDDLALSFQETVGCTEIWEQILQIQARMNASNCNVEELELLVMQEEESEPLPIPNLKSIDTVFQLITKSISRRERIGSAISKEGYLQKLLDLFKACEEPPNLTNLHKMYEIFRALVLYNDSRIFEAIFSEDYFMDVLGVFEYDPETGNQRIKHREFLSKKAVFKEIIPFHNDDLVRKIHQTFRIQYIKDVVLPRVLDDLTFTTLNSLIFYNQLEIITTLKNDKDFFQDLFTKLKSPSETIQHSEKKDIILFISEMCTLAKNLAPMNRTQFYTTMIQKGIYDVLVTTLVDLDHSLRSASVDIINHIVSYDPSLLRKHLISEKPTFAFFRLLINRYLFDSESGITALCGDIVRSLFEEEGLGEPMERDEFLSIFLRELIPTVLAPLSYKDDPTNLKKNAVTKNQVVELLCFCLQHPDSRLKRHILQGKIIEKVLELLTHRERYLALSAVRLLRAVIGTKDGEYLEYISYNNLLDLVVDVFLKNGPRYNLLNSAIIELFEFIKGQGLKELILDVGKKFGDKLKEITYVDTFQRLMAKYEQLLEAPPKSPESDRTPKKRPRRQADTDSDEEYFAVDDENENEELYPETVVNDEEFKLLPRKASTDEDEDLIKTIVKSPKTAKIELPKDKDNGAKQHKSPKETKEEEKEEKDAASEAEKQETIEKEKEKNDEEKEVTSPKEKRDKEAAEGKEANGQRHTKRLKVTSS